MAADASWDKIFEMSGMAEHDFDSAPFVLTAQQIKIACQDFKRTAEKEVRILCKQDTREARPRVFRENGLFILPKHNGAFYIIKGEGYVDIPEITSPIKEYHSQLDFDLKSSKVGNSEMQHLDFAYANSLIRTFFADPSLVLTIRGRKYTPPFSFYVNDFEITSESVQTEVDAGYEGRNQIVLVEAKNNDARNTIIRQLYYPFRQWGIQTGKEIIPVFFEKRVIGCEPIYHIWQFAFTEPDNYNSIQLVRADRYRIAVDA